MNDEQRRSPDQTGLILLAHGSRDALWRQPIEAVHQLVQAMRPDLPCICAYLDACAPDLPAATQTLIAQGVRHLIVLPLFLGTGKHAREDIPRLLDELRRQHPACRFDLQTAAGENPRVTSLLAQLAIEAAAGTEALKHTDFK
ncbi:CbiX/SirB N-terminal domain-containing protein [Comamonas thiooxydans]|uniref:CbiX/SirB N-terminal domain-containing protein n=1 Tax=Comamonas thiooxydans TaxID=363952 RepID=A0AA42Q5H9_9BURK|nr:CbiX/SirB N-terminal domain-containing protein [Comamonas thiooxydans]MDH1335138.1 CbiX/SirB N-terminal domain-containing protein [Comamonas thiooxydans]MDH1475658.1 CbiX/SirB N-terminal domain-containing protein [Comamonas thiooxydans]MDH1740616.1 CbiX/SirB N-terminal domain-containing protein [Comamonas thiooxydans]MDH1786908.1 CbiX/SirB N-terminal domain-containing protein [Comamonas thiooxydans]